MKEGEIVFHDWVVGECIGEGSFGKVYKITREDFGHTYYAALKVIEIPQSQAEVDVIRNDGMDEEGVTEYFHGIVEELVEEFVLMSKLKGTSNIVSYEDHIVVPKEDGFGWTIYIRMELLTPMFVHLKKNALTVRDIIKLGIDICQALEMCQKCNIIHRDIKPENIFISEFGDYKLGDFGIARQLEKTSSGLSKKGTLTYMAPEVFKGEPYNSTVDIYSLGIVLYRFFNNNRAPFLPPAPAKIKFADKEQANVMRMSGAELPKPCNVDGRLAEIVLKACAYNPKERYESASEMKKALQEVLYSKAESKIIYPDGDELKNESVEYVNASKDDRQQEQQGDIQDETRYLSGQQAENEINPEMNWNAGYEPAQQQMVQGETQNPKRKWLAAAIAAGAAAAIAAVAFFAISLKPTSSETTEPAIAELTAEEKGQLEEEQSDVEKTENHSIETETGQLEKSQSDLETEDSSAPTGEAETSEEDSSDSNTEEVQVPLLLSMTIEEAEKTLKEKGLSLGTVTEEYSDSAEKGTIIDQEIASDKEVDKQTSISVTVSKGKELFTVPSVTGLSEEEAVHALTEQKINYKIKRIYDDSTKKGSVVKQSIKKGKKIEKDTVVTLSISKGKKLLTVPKVTGLSEEKAINALVNQKIGYKIKRVYDDSIAKGNVATQSIAQGKKVEKNTIITLNISKGKKQAEKAVPKTSTKTSTKTSKKASTKTTKKDNSTTTKKETEKKKKTTAKKETENSDFKIKNGVLVKYTGKEKEVKIPSGVTKIGNGAFKKSDVSSVKIPSGVTSIGNYAFFCCENLSKIEFPTGLKSIGEQAFGFCDNLRKVELPTGLKSIGYNAFAYCRNLRQVKFATGLKSISDSAFEECNKLCQVELPTGLKSIGNNAFEDCWKLSEIKFPTGLRSIGNDAFFNCKNLSEIKFPTGLKSIGEGAFYYCKNLHQVEFAAGLNSIGDNTFDCTNLGTTEIPDSVKKIGKSAFPSSSSSDDFIIVCSKKSYAREYAEQNGYSYQEK